MDEVLSLCLAGDRDAVRERRAADPDIVAQARARRPDAVLAATELGRGAAVRLLMELGFDVHAGHRMTPLHQAAYDGNAELAGLLLDLGADPTRRDRSFDATSLGWAEHNHQEATVALLRPLTP